MKIVIIVISQCIASDIWMEHRVLMATTGSSMGSRDLGVLGSGAFVSVLQRTWF